MSDHMDLEEVERRLRDIESMRRNFLQMVEEQERVLRQTRDVIMRVGGRRDVLGVEGVDINTNSNSNNEMTNVNLNL